MSYYPREIIDDVIYKVNIVDIIGKYVSLKKKGNTYFGLCPFHNEKTPSFSVSEDKQMYYCFGCHKGGNVITFLMEYENIDFIEALEELANIAGVTLPKENITSEMKKEASLRANVYEANKEAANFYYRQLFNKDNKKGLDFFIRRGLNLDTIKKFGLGFAKGDNNLYKHLKEKGFSDNVLEKSGLFIKDKSNVLKERFWNRVMFPILDTSKNVIAFGGRVLGDGLPKYVNSPETEFYKKRVNLYGYSEARKSKDKRYILCEGYMDTITLHQYGFTGAFASLGTALTKEQAKLISKLYRGSEGYNNLYLIYDSDEAGTNAKLRAIPMLRDEGIIPKIVDLSPYKDPDEFCKNEGKDEFNKRLETAIDSIIFLIKTKEKDYDLSVPADKISFLNKEVASFLATIDNSIERNIYIQTLSEKYNIKIESLEKIVKEKAIINENRQIYENEKTNIKIKPDDTIFLAEKQIITWMVENNSYAKVIKQYISENDFSNELTKKIFLYLNELETIPSNIPSFLIGKFEEENDSELASFFQTHIVKENYNVNTEEKNIKQVIIRIKENTIKRYKESDDKDKMFMCVKLQKALEEFKKINIEI